LNLVLKASNVILMLDVSSQKVLYYDKEIWIINYSNQNLNILFL